MLSVRMAGILLTRLALDIGDPIMPQNFGYQLFFDRLDSVAEYAISKLSGSGFSPASILGTASLIDKRN
jgi:hypothetical protein